MARNYPKHESSGALHRDDDAAETVVSCWLCGRPTGKIIVWHHPVPKSRGGRDVVPMHPACQQTVTANFTNSELQRYGTDVEPLLANPNVRSSSIGSRRRIPILRRPRLRSSGDSISDLPSTESQ
jgi:hypothetical protein